VVAVLGGNAHGAFDSDSHLAPDQVVLDGMSGAAPEPPSGYEFGEGRVHEVSVVIDSGLIASQMLSWAVDVTPALW
jgi:hypothetical protein